MIVRFVLLLMMIGVALGAAPAQAQSSMFVSLAGEHDWALQWIDYLFLGKAIGSGASSSALQSALGMALSFYSMAILVLAGFLLLYHLVFMVAETAATGKVMGRANQLWAPIRLIFAIGMLVPVSASGMNTAQYAVIQISRWGSGLASNVWDKFLNVVADEQISKDCPQDGDQTSPSCIRVAVPALDLVASLMKAEGCAQIFNYYKQYKQSGYAFSAIETAAGVAGTSYDYVDSFLRPLKDAFEPGQKYGRDFLSELKAYKSDGTDYSYKDLCGAYQIPEIVAQNPYYEVYDIYREAFSKLARDAAASVDRIIDSSIEDNDKFGTVPKSEVANVMQKLAGNFSAALKAKIPEYIANVDKILKDDPKYNLAKEGSRYALTGWLTAAAWFSQTTAVVGARSAALADGLPYVTEPLFAGGAPLYLTADTGGKDPTPLVMFDEVSRDYGRFKTALQDAVEDITAKENKSKPPLADKLVTFATGDISTGSLARFLSGNQITVGVLKLVNRVLADVGVTNAENALAAYWPVSANPLLEIAAWGQEYIRAGAAILSIGSTAIASGEDLSFVPRSGAALKNAGGLIGGILISLSGPLFLIGLVLTFVVPLVPFYRFFFGALKWIMTLFEAVVMAPLFALAHVNPYGEGLAGRYGKYGYSVAMQLLLRPILMIFGLIVGYLLFAVTLYFLNDLFTFITKGALIPGDDTVAVIAKLVYSVIYCVIVVILAFHCFRTIGLFPQVALRYLGMGGREESASEPPPPPTIGATGKDTTVSLASPVAIGGTEVIHQHVITNVSATTEKVQSGKVDNSRLIAKHVVKDEP